MMISQMNKDFIALPARQCHQGQSLPAEVQKGYTARAKEKKFGQGTSGYEGKLDCTFLCNNENERKMARVSEKTVSLWTYVNRPQILQTFFNPLYQPNQQVIWPSVAPQSLALWSSLYMRWTMSDTATSIPTQVITDIKQSDKELRFKVNELRRYVHVTKRLI
eukprot:XP_011680874.1 PREDICTED: myotubularin-related protein 9-like [Strongylocentrotus purpuratus]